MVLFTSLVQHRMLLFLSSFFTQTAEVSNEPASSSYCAFESARRNHCGSNNVARCDDVAPAGDKSTESATRRTRDSAVQTVDERPIVDDAEERHHAARRLARQLWCERCNSHLLVFKWRAVRVWLPLARQRLHVSRQAVDQHQVR